MGALDETTILHLNKPSSPISDGVKEQRVDEMGLDRFHTI